MCGIAGYVGTAAPGVLSEMLRTLRHRGPDDTGLHEEPSTGLGMTRLAIIDLAGGRQPMTNEDGSLWIVFNGEIYNHRELQRDLEARGHRFRSRSDTEAILHLYEDAGERCVERLRGMFAFAIWDAARATLFLARDRLGKKPLYYRHQDGLFLFASEIKALLCHPAVSRQVNLDAFHHYLAFGYTPAEDSIFAGIRKLPPAHTALLHRGDLTVRGYWRLPAGQAVARLPQAETAARVRHALQEAVSDRLESDVPLGVFLSGGVDSSAVVACMREATGQRIATFSIGFGASVRLLRRTPVRPPGGAALRDRSHRGDPGAQGGRSPPHAGRSLRRAVRRFLGHPDLRRGPGHRPPCQGGALRDRGRRDVRRLPALPGRPALRALPPPAVSPPRDRGEGAGWLGGGKREQPQLGRLDPPLRDRCRATHAGPLHRLDALFQRRGAGAPGDARPAGRLERTRGFPAAGRLRPPALRGTTWTAPSGSTSAPIFPTIFSSWPTG